MDGKRADINGGEGLSADYERPVLMDNLYEKLKNFPFVMAGPCVIESRDICFKIAETCLKAAEEASFLYIFKASFDKANRTSVRSYRGVGIDEGMRLFEDIRTSFGIPVVTDIHESSQAEAAAQACDILQIPAFLCRQTDLLLAAGKTGRVVNIKKAQFLSAADMIYPLEKVRSTGNGRLLLTERGTMFGYNNLVVDFRNLVDMAGYGVPVVMDITHSTQRPGGLGGKSGGNPEYAPYMAAASAAVGVRGFFMETHPEPSQALSDGPNMVKLSDFKSVLEKITRHMV